MNVTPELLERYYSGLCSAEERRAVELWQENTEADPEILLPSGQDKNSHKEQIWAPLASMLQKDSTCHEQKETPASVTAKINNRLFLRIAACLVATIGVASSLYFYQQNKQENQQNASVITYKTIRTQQGQKASFVLEEGTVVHLNGESEFKYPEKFTDSSQIVYLQGEAHFDVAKITSKPFFVYTSRTLTRVLGTRFNLRAYRAEDVILAVEEGRVRFGGINYRHSQHQIYTANKVGIYTVAGKLTSQSIPVSEYSGWIENKMAFTGQSLIQIIPVLERWYGVTIKLNKNSLKKETFTGEFNNPPLSFLLGRLSFVMKFNYTVYNNTIIIR